METAQVTIPITVTLERPTAAQEWTAVDAVDDVTAATPVYVRFEGEEWHTIGSLSDDVATMQAADFLAMVFQHFFWEQRCNRATAARLAAGETT